MPHERAVRSWLRRSTSSPDDVDELIQDSYCRFSMLESVDHIENPRAYFFSVARNLLGRRIKRAKVVPIEAIAEADAFEDEAALSPERQAGSRLDYARLRALMAALPLPCREIVELRKLHGYSQRDIAAKLGISESVVENQVHRGVKAILQAWTREDDAVQGRLRSFEARGRRR